MIIVYIFVIMNQEIILLYYILFSSNLTAEDAVIHFLITIFVFMISLTLHEFAHAFAAFKCGDPTAKLSGRMTLNPLKHIDLTGFLMFIFLGVGWARPVPINPMNFKKYKTGTRIVSSAGVLANFAIGLLSAIIYTVLIATIGSASGIAMGYVYTILIYFMLVNSFLFMFNILPIPPLDGFNFISTFVKQENKFMNYMAKNGFKVLIGILLVGLLTDLLFGFDIFTVYLELMYKLVYTPITWLGA